MQEQSLSSNFMNVKEVSEYLGVKSSTIYTMVEEKRIPHYRIGRQIRFKTSDIDQWLEGEKHDVVDVKVKARRIIRSVEKRPTQDVDRIVKKVIDEANRKGYNLDHGKPDRIKGLIRKEVEDGTI